MTTQPLSALDFAMKCYKEWPNKRPSKRFIRDISDDYAHLAVLYNEAKSDNERLIKLVDKQIRAMSELVLALYAIIEVDKTHYNQDEPRPDGMLPEADGGTIWNTPKQIAQNALPRRGCYPVLHNL